VREHTDRPRRGLIAAVGVMAVPSVCAALAGIASSHTNDINMPTAAGLTWAARRHYLASCRGLLIGGTVPPSTTPLRGEATPVLKGSQ